MIWCNDKKKCCTVSIRINKYNFHTVAILEYYDYAFLQFQMLLKQKFARLMHDDCAC